MSGIHKFSKISMVVSLLIASASWVHAMEPEDEDYDELTAAVILSLQTPTDEDQTDNDLTPAEWAAIQQSEADARGTLHNNWVTGPQEDKADMPSLRADFMPTYLKEGQGLGDMLVLMEKKRAIGINTWMKRADQNKKQMEQRKIETPAAPQPTQAELDARQAIQQLNGLKKADPKHAPRPLPQPPQAEENKKPSVNAIADQFGGRGGKPAEEK